VVPIVLLGQLAGPPATAARVVPVEPGQAISMNLYAAGDFVSQARGDWCVPASILTMANLISTEGTDRWPSQGSLDRLARSRSTDRLVGPGSEPEGWAASLNELGLGPYVVVSVRTRHAAIATAARAIWATGRPVGLLVWRGAHAWVMSGFEATIDADRPADLDVTHVRVLDAWYPRTSSIWGPGHRPNSKIAVADLAADFLPWRRPGVRYVEKDGQYVLVLPIAAPIRPGARPLFGAIRLDVR
jgi:hypothetical protein